MALASLVVCLLQLWFYDWSKRDWLGIEAVKSVSRISASGSSTIMVLPYRFLRNWANCECGWLAVPYSSCVSWNTVFLV